MAVFTRLFLAAGAACIAFAAFGCARAGDFRATPCPFSNPGAASCGYLSAPLHHDRPGGAKIEIAVAIYPPTAAPTHPDPVFFLGGGPGFPTLGSSDGRAIIPITATGRTLVELDQRGLAHSRPRLGCPELTALQFVDPDIALAGSVEQAVLNYAPGPPLRRALAAAKSCRDRLTDSGVDVAAFNSNESADDIEDLRRALGYERIDLFGTSYGTRLALVVLRRHPRHIRAAILDGVFPPQKGAKNSGEETVEAYGALFDWCAGNVACAANHPHLPQEVVATAARLDAAPVTLTIAPYHVEGPATVRARVTGDTFLAVLAYALAYEDARLLPDMIGETGRGDYSKLGILYSYQFDTQSTYGMHYSIECGEDEAFSPPPVLRRYAEALPRYLRGPFLRGQIGDWRMCEAWNVPKKADFRDPVVSDIPVLLLSGQFDWATPPSWAALAAQTLSHSKSRVFPRVGHQTYFRRACSRQVADAWLNDPGAPLQACDDEDAS